jgi:hypothetical protein
MKTSTRTLIGRKRVLLPAGVIAGGLVLGSGVAAVGAVDGADNAGENITGEDLNKASEAALKEVGDGEVVSAEVSDDKGVAYELEVRQSDGTEVDVDLDENYGVVHTDTDAPDNDGDDDGDDDDDDDRDDDDNDDDGNDADDRRLTDEEWSSIEDAAISEAGGGTLTDAEASDDKGSVFEAEVRLDDGTELDVWLDEDFGVVDSQEDQDD